MMATNQREADAAALARLPLERDVIGGGAMNRQQRREIERQQHNARPDEKDLVAVHEAGHAVLQELTGLSVTFIDLEWRKDGLGAKTGHRPIMRAEFQAMMDDDNTFMGYLVGTVGGIQAEHIFLARVYPKYDPTRRRVIEMGGDDQRILGGLLNAWMDTGRPEAAFTVLTRKAEQMAVRLLAANWQAVVAVAIAALDAQHQRLTGDEVRAIVAHPEAVLGEEN